MCAVFYLQVNGAPRADRQVSAKLLDTAPLFDAGGHCPGRCPVDLVMELPVQGQRARIVVTVAVILGDVVCLNSNPGHALQVLHHGPRSYVLDALVSSIRKYQQGNERYHSRKGRKNRQFFLGQSSSPLFTKRGLKR